MPIFKRYGRRVEIFAEDIMNLPIATVQASSSIQRAAEVMWAKKIGCLIVVDNNGKLSGIITERDIIYACAKGFFQKEGGNILETIMSKNVVSAEPTDNITSVIEKMRSHNVRHMPVVGNDGKPVGIISLRDILDVSLGLLGLFTLPD